MIDINQPQTEFSHGPAEITPENVQYWCHHTQKFAHSQVHKALKFIELNCIEYNGEGFFICNPIPGYNTRTYIIRKNDVGDFECNCQRGKEGAEMCSHILALYYSFKLKRFTNKGVDKIIDMGDDGNLQVFPMKRVQAHG